MEVRIVEFTIELYADVRALWESCEGIGLSSADSREAIETYLERNRGMSFVALAGEKVVGAALCGHDGRRGYIHHLAVSKDLRGREIGKRLESKCLDALKSAGIEKCHLFVFKENREGAGFWEAIGWGKRDDLALYSKTID